MKQLPPTPQDRALISHKRRRSAQRVHPRIEIHPDQEPSRSPLRSKQPRTQLMRHPDQRTSARGNERNIVAERLHRDRSTICNSVYSRTQEEEPSPRTQSAKDHTTRQTLQSPVLDEGHLITTKPNHKPPKGSTMNDRRQEQLQRHHRHAEASTGTGSSPQ